MPYGRARPGRGSAANSGFTPAAIAPAPNSYQAPRSRAPNPGRPAAWARVNLAIAGLGPSHRSAR
jgi:hypothetical protein